MTTAKPASIDEYIAGFPEEIREILNQIRAAIREAAPDAKEKISYAIPTFTLNNSPLVYFAAFQNHIGFYPTPTGSDAFKQDFAPYKTSKGTVQFPLDKPMPLNLITSIVAFRVRENLEKADQKK